LVICHDVEDQLAESI